MKPSLLPLLAAAAALALAPRASAQTQEQAAQPGPTVSTFSVIGYDPATGELGVAVQSRVFSVGNGVIWAKAGVGAVATQAVANVGYGPRALELLEKGTSPADAVKQLIAADADPLPQTWPRSGRQLAVMDAHGVSAAWTGPTAPEWAGNRSAENVSVQGNLLAGPEVLDAMLTAFQETKGHLSQRLMAALEAGQAAGGDRRGMQSAALIVVKQGGGPWLENDVEMRLQVDDNTRPLAELRRLVELANVQRSLRR